MKKRSHLRQALMSSTLGVSILCVSSFGPAVVTQAQEEVSSEQAEALNAVAQMAEGQRTYYKDNGEFLNRVDEMQKYFGITLPPDYDYAIRTTTEAAYNYVIPTDDSLKAYVGATFLALDGSGELTTIICENQDTGLERPADPQLVRDPLNPTQIGLQCGEYSVEVPASKVTE